jgi:hypothetical protein
VHRLLLFPGLDIIIVGRLGKLKNGSRNVQKCHALWSWPPYAVKAFLHQFHCNSGFQLLYVCKGPSLEVTPSILAGIMNGLNAITETFTGNIAEAALPRQTSKLKCSFQMVWQRRGKLVSSAEKFPTSNPRCYPLRTCLCSMTLLGNPPSKFSV